ncbi:hypothetical protein N0V88_002152 [Collariella sp. IMI 366227]|nr:hypothetical protein N0V88_002152 [Collariella sp. IMI 366227]
MFFGNRGDRDCGHGTSEVVKVIQDLESQGIPSCITGARALVYYGVGKVPQDWEVAVPDELFEKATTLFVHSLDYKTLEPATPQPKSLVHTYPLFKLKGAEFTFALVPTFQSSVDCDPTKCERSHNGIPYPQLRYFVQSLLDTQKYADLEDLIDGMNLDEAWGAENLDLDGVPREHINRKNEKICESLPGLPGLMASLSTTPDARREWAQALQGKRSRMVPKYPEDKYATRFRLLESPDPRLDLDREV